MVLDPCVQVETLVQTFDCKCSYDNPLTRIVQSIIFNSETTNTKVAEDPAIQVYPASSMGLYAESESELIMKKSEFYLV